MNPHAPPPLDIVKHQAPGGGVTVTISRPRRHPNRAVQLRTVPAESASPSRRKVTDIFEGFETLRSRTPSPPPSTRRLSSQQGANILRAPLSSRDVPAHSLVPLSPSPLPLLLPQGPSPPLPSASLLFPALAHNGRGSSAGRNRPIPLTSKIPLLEPPPVAVHASSCSKESEDVGERDEEEEEEPKERTSGGRRRSATAPGPIPQRISPRASHGGPSGGLSGSGTGTLARRPSVSSTLSAARCEDFPWPLTDMADFEFGAGGRARRPLRNYIVLVNLPVVSALEVGAQTETLRTTITGRDAVVIDVYHPMERDGRRTKGVAFVELDSPIGAASVVSRLPSLTLPGGAIGRLFKGYRSDDLSLTLDGSDEASRKSAEEDVSPEAAKTLAAAKAAQRYAEESRLSTLERLADFANANADLRSDLSASRADTSTLKSQQVSLSRENEALRASLAEAGPAMERGAMVDKWSLLLQFVDPTSHSLLSPVAQPRPSVSPPIRAGGRALVSRTYSTSSTASGEATHPSLPRPSSSSRNPTPPVSPPPGPLLGGGGGVSAGRDGGGAQQPYTLEELDGVFAALQAALSRVKLEQVRLAQSKHAAAEQELAKLQEAKACGVCLDAERSTVLMPCGHVILCGTCAASGEIKDCPICRTPIQKVMNIFM